ncbi:hypothetical protein FNV43_RR09248 [Rhamnella rubrinervis]|uniref:Uncharacterized protein n=1 Tax=Rhamnella rubrinervis TaxID=2594499 RepID=A0A8K0MK63_9ROSA|nr:hypothetical protein FNV43_RR09248 [Rhamnella rubrinervis]
MKGKRSRTESWNDAPHDILLKIFLDLNMIKSGSFDIPQEAYAWSDEESEEKLLHILKNAMNLSSGNMTCLVFHFYAFLKNEHLICAAERSPKLKRLALPAWNQLNAIDTHCKNFTQLKIMCPFDLEFAKAIIKYTPELKVLSLRRALVYKDALTHILNKLKHLEVLNVKHCLLDDSEHDGFIVAYRKYEEETIEKASRLKNFLFCQESSCPTCQRAFDDEGILKWFEYEEGLWRADELDIAVWPRTMGIQSNPIRLPCGFLMIMFILMVTQFSTCRHLHRITSEETNKPADKNEFYTRFSWHSSAKAAEGSTKYEHMDPSHGVSLRVVPTGPNPLHN